MLKHIESYVDNCVRCLKNQPSIKAPITPLQPLPVIAKVWFRVGMDLTGPLVESEGYKYILTFIDHFTKWIETRLLRSKSADEVAKAIFSIYCRQGAPVQIISDNGTEFKNQISKALQAAHNCKLIFSTPYHPQTNGLVESTHKALKRSMVKSLGEKKENWSHYLEEITFSLNIRPRDTTQFSAFELMHGSRKPRLPTEAENLSLLYPDIASVSCDQDQNELLEYMRTAQDDNFQIAEDSLTHSKEVMKKRHDRKLNPITFCKLEETDEVLIENVYQKKKGGKLQDKWLGPYPVVKATQSNVHIVRNKTTQRVMRSKVKLYKRSFTDTATETPPIKYQRLESDSVDIQHTLSNSPSTPFTGVEETVFETNIIQKTRAEVMELLDSFKDKIISSLKSTIPVSDLHRELDKRQHLPFRKLFDWRHEHFPPTKYPEQRLMDHETSQEMADILIQWYLECCEIKIPMYQYTDDDFKFATYWQEKAMNYTTKVLHPVVTELIINAPQAANENSNKNTPLPLSFPLEDLCVSWGGYCHGIELVNTCSVDNFITLLSLHINSIFTAFELIRFSPNLLLENILSLIHTLQFNKVRTTICQLIGIPLENSQYNMLGYEGRFVQLLCKDLSLNSDGYKINFQCWGCCFQSEKILNLSCLTTFDSSCQMSINTQINSRFACLKCRDQEANIEPISMEFSEIPPIFILEVGHLTHSVQICEIDDTITFSQADRLLCYTLLGFTIHRAVHFSMRVRHDTIWYSYDGMESPKLTQIRNKEKDLPGRVNCIIYVLNNIVNSL